MNWYYLNESGEVVGPISEETLKELSAAGALTGETQVYPEGTEAWTSLAEALGTDTGASVGGAIEDASENSDSVEAINPLTPESLVSDSEATAFGSADDPVNAPENTTSNSSAADRIKAGAKAGWTGVKRNSKLAVLHAKIEKLRNVDLRRAHHALGKRCCDLGLLKDQLEQPFAAIREVVAKIAADRGSEEAPDEEKKVDAFKRMTRQATKAPHAQALNLKLQHLLTEIGRLAYRHSEQGSLPGVEAEVEAIGVVESQIRQKESEIENMGGEEKLLDKDVKDFSIRSALPLFVCCLGFGWVSTLILPDRYFIAEGVIGNLLPVLLLAVPALALSLLAMFTFLRPSTIKWTTVLGGLFFTMTLGLMILFAFFHLADSSRELANRSYGKASAFVYAVKAIGWAGQNMESASLFQRLLASIIHTGLCEEVTKMLPVFLVVLLNRKKTGLPALKGFLLLGFFSGIGFGIGEALLGYSPWSGTTGINANVSRWFACVPLHGIYTVVDSAFLWLLIPTFKKAKGIGEAVATLVAAALAIAVVHGVYNTIAASNILLAIICDGGAIILMVVVVRYCAAFEETNNGGADQIAISIPRLPEWLQARSNRSPAFGRLYVVAGVLLLVSILFSSSPPRLSAPAASSFADYVKGEFGFELDNELKFAYLAGYALGSLVNRPITPGAIEKDLPMLRNPGVHPAYGDLYLLGFHDSYNHRPRRVDYYVLQE